VHWQLLGYTAIIRLRPQPRTKSRQQQPVGRYTTVTASTLYGEDFSRNGAKAQSATACLWVFVAPLRLCVRKIFLPSGPRSNLSTFRAKLTVTMKTDQGKRGARVFVSEYRQKQRHKFVTDEKRQAFQACRKSLKEMVSRAGLEPATR
jgi:hypothetical protein